MSFNLPAVRIQDPSFSGVPPDFNWPAIKKKCFEAVQLNSIKQHRTASKVRAVQGRARSHPATQPSSGGSTL
ncbi:hypothetical protein Y1Q_0016990 [Alligator mississippiensis]|uniref:Uncharacterized protein n=1 Tax=Alligator mississippiensis TaxID=8496 RepID=A0A151N3D6_ALLMI|nr:hypothetical protein Y1Q_0016990 [Alligator mississippiensis]